LRGRFVDHGIGLAHVGIAGIEPAALEQALHPRGDPREHAANFLVGRRRQGSELERAVPAVGEEDAVEQQHVVVDIEIESAPEALDDRHRARSPVANSVAAGAVALKAEQHAHSHAEHSAGPPVISRQQIAQPVRQAPHPTGPTKCTRDLHELVVVPSTDRS